MRTVLIASVIAAAGCATQPEAPTQTPTGPSTYRVEQGGEVFALDTSKARLGRRVGLGTMGGLGSYCAMSLDVRADGSVARVKMLGSRSDQLELVCRRAAYDWTLQVTRDGEAVAFDGLVGGIVIAGQNLGAGSGPESVSLGVTITFDTEAISAIRERRT